MKAMLLAAGFGTRLRPITYTLPKPLAPLCGRPLIAWAIESLLAAGIRDFVVNLHHLPEPIERYLHERYTAESRFEFSYEPEILGTGGGVRKVRALLENDPEFFLVNGDTIQFPPYEALRATRNDALAALLLRHPPRGDRFTPVYVDDGIVTGFGRGTGEALMFSGTHLISRRIFDYLPDKDFSGIVDEVYQPLIDSGRERIAGVVDDGLWFDIGTPQRYVEASRLVLRRELVLRRVRHLTEALGLGDEALGDAPQLLGLRVGRLDRLMENEVGREAAEHGAARAGVAVELATRITMTHGLLSSVSQACACCAFQRSSICGQLSIFMPSERPMLARISLISLRLLRPKFFVFSMSCSVR